MSLPPEDDSVVLDWIIFGVVAFVVIVLFGLGLAAFRGVH